MSPPVPADSTRITTMLSR